MVKVYLNNDILYEEKCTDYNKCIKNIELLTNFTSVEFYLEQNGKPLHDAFSHDNPIRVRLRLLGGKGGFGSMLRAIGAQIEKTTNREACRDLSGRRLRDINEEKRLKAWLEKQGEREREAEERKKRKIEKLLAVPKHEFKDSEYEESRSKLTEKVCDAVEEGFKKSAASQKLDLKRKCEEASTSKKAAAKSKKKKSALWIDDDLSSSSETSDDSDSEEIKYKKKQKPLTAFESNKSLATNNTTDDSNSSISEQNSVVSK